LRSAIPPRTTTSSTGERSSIPMTTLASRHMAPLPADR
jgi:hypothetical protein